MDVKEDILIALQCNELPKDRASVVTETSTLVFFFLFVRWDFGYCGHYWPIVPAPDDR
jgi:hypothetical protein